MTNTFVDEAGTLRLRGTIGGLPNPFSLLGPFRVNFNSADFYNSTGFVLAALDPGQIALDARPWVRADWTTGGAQVNFTVDLLADGAYHNLFTWDQVIGQPVADGGAAAAGGSLEFGTSDLRWAIASGVSALVAQSYMDAPTAGACDVYALVYTP